MPDNPTDYVQVAIKVPRWARDRFKKLAKAGGQSMAGQFCTMVKEATPDEPTPEISEPIKVTTFDWL